MTFWPFFLFFNDEIRQILIVNIFKLLLLKISKKIDPKQSQNERF